VSFDPGRIKSIVVTTASGDDTVDVKGLPANVALTVNLGGGNDAVNSSQENGQPDNVLGAVNIQGSGNVTGLDDFFALLAQAG
jgi:hypothetical protein